jgi:SAM-dependent methyltransferase
MSTSWRTRSSDSELLDAPTFSRPELSRSLEHVASVNRWLGGLRSQTRELSSLRGQDVRVLDVGTGNGEALERLLRWGALGGGRWTGVGLDIHPDILAVARHRPESAVPLVRADALALPFASRAFDVVLCTLTLHHFQDGDAVHLLRELARCARRIVLVSDLERGPLAYLGARLLALTWWRADRITRHDGPVSVLRAFTREELAELARRANLGAPRVKRWFPFRLTLAAEP